MSVSGVNSSNESVLRTQFASSTELEVDNAKPSSETELGSSDVDVALPDSSRRSSAVAFLNYMRECKRRFGSKHLGQGFANAATKRWRAMSPEHRARYRRSEYRSASTIKPSKSSLLCREDNELDSTAALSVVPSGFSLDEVDCDMKRKSKRSCSKPKRKKSACGKRRRRKSACKKRKSRKSKKSCSKPRRRKSRKAKCKGGAPH
ncbi:histone-like protein 18C isoform X2 [Drosophila pseudoobscura]|uniref:Histone-like protein 18C isoform X2 n=1 Tax=Drosophila pseudoobscura pseudoobscura TaxID=46245 RepID=A0A6I8V3Y3_DROPS|nr:histone-like protein 18C isoform X2 [Drosophila pseudoobscura]